MLTWNICFSFQGCIPILHYTHFISTKVRTQQQIKTFTCTTNKICHGKVSIQKGLILKKCNWLTKICKKGKKENMKSAENA